MIDLGLGNRGNKDRKEMIDNEKVMGFNRLASE